ncbi:MAG: hypothetical protein F4078_02565, partial [Acidimicrobiia bacterium]|nr:hypothetical protein [Acidimicrobiia bacterium]
MRRLALGLVVAGAGWLAVAAGPAAAQEQPRDAERAAAVERSELAGHVEPGQDCAEGVTEAAAAASRVPEPGADLVQIVEVVGLMDPVQAEFVVERIRTPSYTGSGVLAVVLRVHSRRAV